MGVFLVKYMSKQLQFVTHAKKIINQMAKDHESLESKIWLQSVHNNTSIRQQ